MAVSCLFLLASLASLASLSFRRLLRTSAHRQIHLAAALNGERAAVGPEKAGTSAVLEEWDGCATFELPSLEQFEAAFQDPYYINLISKDEETFVDKKRGVIRRRGYTNRVI